MKITVYCLVLGLIISCATFNKMEPSAPLDAIKSPPTTDDSYTTLPFKKVVNPAFAEECANKWIRCNVQFQSQFDHVMDLPSEYTKGYVRFFCCDIDNRGTMSNNIVIPKAKSDLIFELKHGDTIELFAYLMPLSTRSAVSGREQSDILFIVEKLRKTVSDSKTARSSSTMKEAQEPTTRSITVLDTYDDAFRKAIRTMSAMGAEIISQDSKLGIMSAKLHNAVILNISVATQPDGKSQLNVTGIVMPNKVVVGEFTEVDDFVNAYQGALKG